MSSENINGFTTDKFSNVRSLFAKNLESGDDLGASFCATIEGETVVDLWGGWADPAKTRPWEKDTIVNVYSTTKTMTALCALMVADRGELDFDAPVSKYWPEFAANGKSEVKVSHLMAHSAGLPTWTTQIVLSDLYDWEKATTLLAAQAPLWKPGSQPGYHGVTQGYLVGEVVRRITGQSLGEFFRTEIAEPLQADFHIGLGAEHDRRVAELVPYKGEIQMTGLAARVMENPLLLTSGIATRAWRAAEIPAAGGHGNAKAIAQIQSIMSNGGEVNGKRFMSESGCRRALELQIAGDDVVFGAPVRYGLGFGLPPTFFDTPHANSIYWGGYGGSLVLIDMDARCTFSYVMNNMWPTGVGDERSLSMIREMWKALGYSFKS